MYSFILCGCSYWILLMWVVKCEFFWRHFHFREKRFKEEIEQYRQERPKIQQQFSDLKVLVFGVVF